MEQVATHSEQATSYRWLIIVTIMMVAILEVLDSTIVNVALPAMMPTLGANQEQVTWVLTSYVVASAMMLPLTGFLSKRFGHKQLLIISIVGFLLSSVACGLSNSLSTMVIFRLLQGAFGASLIPLSQSILRQSFPLEEQGKAMAIWGLGIMAAPVFGPTLGGFITEYSSWRWVFYINIPVCILALTLTMMVIPSSTRIKQKIDWLGIALMFASIGALQIVLDQGNSKDWFSSNMILLLAIISVFSIILFIIRNLTYRNPSIKLTIYKDRNFTLSCISLLIFCGCIFGIITLQPILLEGLFHYTAIDAGITTLPLGLASAVGMIITSQIMNRINVKFILIAALVCCTVGAYYLTTLDLNASQNNFFIANAILGLGLGLFMVPISIYSLATIKKQDVTEASGLFSYSRMLGTSIGISLLSTLVSRETQIIWHRLGGHISKLNPKFHWWLSQSHMSLQQKTTIPILGQQLSQQASMVAFIDAYYAIAIGFVILIPLILMMKRVDLKDVKPGAH